MDAQFAIFGLWYHGKQLDQPNSGLAGKNNQGWYIIKKIKKLQASLCAVESIVQSQLSKFALRSAV